MYLLLGSGSLVGQCLCHSPQTPYVLALCGAKDVWSQSYHLGAGNFLRPCRGKVLPFGPLPGMRTRWQGLH